MASFGYSWYDFSIRGFFQGVNMEMMIWAIIFLIFLFVMNIIFKRAFKNQKATGTVIALAVSTLSVFYMSKKIDILPMFYSTGIDASFIKPVLYILGAIFLIFIIYKWGISALFLLLGLVLLISGIFGWAYQGALAIIIGVILILIGLWIRKKWKLKRPRFPKWEKGRSKTPSPPSPRKPTPPPKTSGPDPRDKINLARRLGIKKLTEEYQKMLREYNEGLKKATQYHKDASRLGWTKTKDGKEAYKRWYRQYSRNIQLQKEAKRTYDRIQHLQKQLK